MSEIKLCPWCGRNPRVQQCKIWYDQLHGDPQQDYRVICPDCNVEKKAHTKENAIATWNARFPSAQGVNADILRVYKKYRLSETIWLKNTKLIEEVIRKNPEVIADVFYEMWSAIKTNAEEMINDNQAQGH